MTSRASARRALNSGVFLMVLFMFVLLSDLVVVMMPYPAVEIKCAFAEAAQPPAGAATWLRPRLQPHALEVAVARRHGGSFGLTRRLVVGALPFRIGALEADRVGVEHTHRAPARERLPAPVAIRLREKRVHRSLLSIVPPRRICRGGVFRSAPHREGDDPLANVDRHEPAREQLALELVPSAPADLRAHRQPARRAVREPPVRQPRRLERLLDGRLDFLDLFRIRNPYRICYSHRRFPFVCAGFLSPALLTT